MKQTDKTLKHVVQFENRIATSLCVNFMKGTKEASA